MEIERILDENTGLPTLRYRGALDTLAHGLVDQTALIFLGAGCNAGEGETLPTADKLAREMAEACGLEWHQDIPLSTIAFYYESFHSRENLNAFLARKFLDHDVLPSATLRNLVDIIVKLESRATFTLVVTTNYDRQLEKAYHTRTGRDLDVVVYNGGTDANRQAAVLHPAIRSRPALWLPKSLTTLYKMHGCISMPESLQMEPPELHNLVVTEEDYINFLSNAMSNDPYKPLPTHVMARIAESTTLFIGYGLTDWNFRVVFKATAERNDKKGYAIQLFQPSGARQDTLERRRAAVDFWGQKKVDIINVDAATFVADLSDAVDREIATRPVPTDRRQPIAVPG